MFVERTHSYTDAIAKPTSWLGFLGSCARAGTNVKVLEGGRFG